MAARSCSRRRRPKLGNIDFGDGHDAAFLVLSLVLLPSFDSRDLGSQRDDGPRSWQRSRGSESAAASIGIDATARASSLFALSAAIAGLGGGLLRYTHGGGQLQPETSCQFRAVWVVLVVTLGGRTVEGAIQAAIGSSFFAGRAATWVPWLVNHAQPWYHMASAARTLAIILFGLGALTYAKHPEGVLEFNKRKSSTRRSRIDGHVSRRAVADGGDRRPTAEPLERPPPAGGAQ